jgi:hypothetical protein
MQNLHVIPFSMAKLTPLDHDESEPQSTYRGRVAIGGVYLPSQLERTLQLCM